MKNLIWRIVRSNGSFSELVLIVIEIITRIRPNKKILDIYYVLFIHSITRTETTLKFLMLEEANFLRNLRMRKLCWMILKRIENGRGLKKSEHFSIFVNNVLATGDLLLLERILGMQTDLDELPGYRELIQACVQFANQDEDWIDAISSCVSHLGSIDKSKALNSEYIKHTLNYHPQVQYKHLLDQVKLSLSNELEPQNGTNSIALISCDTRYFNIFSEYFCKQFRQKNTIEIMFWVILDENSDLIGFEKTRQQVKKYSAVQVRTKYTNENVAMRSSIERYVVAADLMVERQSNVAILDIDLNINFDITKFFANEMNAISVHTDNVGAIPWSRFGCGFANFPYSNYSVYFLRLMQKYSLFALQNEPGWALDPTAMSVVEHYLRSKNLGREFNVFGLEIIQKMTRSIPSVVRSAKWTAKQGNLF